MEEEWVCLFPHKAKRSLSECGYCRNTGKACKGIGWNHELRNVPQKSIFVLRSVKSVTNSVGKTVIPLGDFANQQRGTFCIYSKLWNSIKILTSQWVCVNALFSLYVWRQCGSMIKSHPSLICVPLAEIQRSDSTICSVLLCPLHGLIK